MVLNGSNNTSYINIIQNGKSIKDQLVLNHIHQISLMEKVLYAGNHPKTLDSAHCLACLIQKQTKWKHDPLITSRLEETEEL